MFHVKQSINNNHLFSTIIDILYDDNHHLNLSGIKEKQGMYEQHIEDSLCISKLIKSSFSKTETIYDLGSGAGFPGLVIAIENPNKNVIMVDSNHKKTNFIKKILKTLKIQNVTVENKRIENLGKPQNADIVCAKALSSLDVLLEYAYPLLKMNGSLIAMKSSNITKELDDSYAVSELLGFSKPKFYPYSIFEKERQLIVFNLIEKSKIELPRKNGEAKNKPLRSKI